ncbi:hypothetical protein V6Z12_D05G397600 [Gossypium hirsutum]
MIKKKNQGKSLWFFCLSVPSLSTVRVSEKELRSLLLLKSESDLLFCLNLDFIVNLVGRVS